MSVVRKNFKRLDTVTTEVSCNFNPVYFIWEEVTETKMSYLISTRMPQSQLLARSTTSNNARTFPFAIPFNPDLKQIPHILIQL